MLETLDKVNIKNLVLENPPALDEFDPRSFLTMGDYERLKKDAELHKKYYTELVLTEPDRADMTFYFTDYYVELAVLFPSKREELAESVDKTSMEAFIKNEIYHFHLPTSKIHETGIYSLISNYKILFPDEDYKELDEGVREIHALRGTQAINSAYYYYSNLALAVPDILPELKNDSLFHKNFIHANHITDEDSVEVIVSFAKECRILGLKEKDEVYSANAKRKIKDYLQQKKGELQSDTAFALAISQADEITFNPGLTLTFHTPLSEEGKLPYPEMEKV